jgi:sulfatase modifying factor 1
MPRGMVRIEAGTFRPFYSQPGVTTVKIAAFALDSVPVSEKEFFRTATSRADRPATRVSFVAAEAYCKARGARLPTTNEWEYVALASETSRNASALPSFRQRVLELTMRMRPATFTIGSGMRNVWGVRDIHGGVNEWTHDFGHHKHGENCAAGTLQTGDGSDYAAFMRYAFRSAATTTTTASNVGFRCASSI